MQVISARRKQRVVEGSNRRSTLVNAGFPRIGGTFSSFHMCLDSLGQFGVIQKFTMRLENGGLGAPSFVSHLLTKFSELFFRAAQPFGQSDLTISKERVERT